MTACHMALRDLGGSLLELIMYETMGRHKVALNAHFGNFTP